MPPFLFRPLPFSWPYAGPPTLITFLTAAAFAFVYTWIASFSQRKKRLFVLGIAVGLSGVLLGIVLTLLGVYKNQSTLAQVWTDFDHSFTWLSMLFLGGVLLHFLYTLFGIPVHTIIPRHLKRKKRGELQ